MNVKEKLFETLQLLSIHRAFLPIAWCYISVRNCRSVCFGTHVLESAAVLLMIAWFPRLVSRALVCVPTAEKCMLNLTAINTQRRSGFSVCRTVVGPASLSFLLCCTPPCPAWNVGLPQPRCSLHRLHHIPSISSPLAR